MTLWSLARTICSYLLLVPIKAMVRIIPLIYWGCFSKKSWLPVWPERQVPKRKDSRNFKTVLPGQFVCSLITIDIHLWWYPIEKYLMCTQAFQMLIFTVLSLCFHHSARCWIEIRLLLRTPRTLTDIIIWNSSATEFCSNNWAVVRISPTNLNVTPQLDEHLATRDSTITFAAISVNL